LLRETDRRLNLLPRSDGTPNRYKKITFWKDGIDELLVQVFLESYGTAPEEIVLDVGRLPHLRPDDPP
jgi:hypothetical protein